MRERYFRVFIFLFVSLVGSAWARTDFIDVKEICNAIKNDETKINLVASRLNEQTNCKNFQEGFEANQKVNLTHPLVVTSFDEEKSEVSQYVSSIDESDLSKICESFEEKKEGEVSLTGLEFEIPNNSNENNPPKKSKWRIIFTFGPFLADYAKTNMRLVNGDSDLMVKGVKPLQRTSLHHYLFWTDRTKFGQFIDEPQNRITLEIANDKMFIGLEYNHPKILFQDMHDTPDNNSSVDIEGTLAGEYISEQGVPLSRHIFQISASHGNTNINAYVGKAFTLAKGRKSKLELRLGVGAGISFANGVTKYWYTDENGDRKLDITEKEGMKVYGHNAALKTGLRYEVLDGLINFNATYDGVLTRIDGPLGGFDKVQTTLYGQQYGIAVGVSFDKIFKKKGRK